jgi:hypothetical protein
VGFYDGLLCQYLGTHGTADITYSADDMALYVDGPDSTVCYAYLPRLEGEQLVARATSNYRLLESLTPSSDENQVRKALACLNMDSVLHKIGYGPGTDPKIQETVLMFSRSFGESMCLQMRVQEGQQMPPVGTDADDDSMSMSMSMSMSDPPSRPPKRRCSSPNPISPRPYKMPRI